jgi:NADH-quinone oxidoreductase subunit C
VDQAEGLQEKVRGFMKERFGDAVLREDNFRGQQSFYVKPDTLIPICEALFDDLQLDLKYLSDITAVDWYGHEEEKNGRFEVVYNLYSLTHHNRVFLKMRLDGENPTVATLTNLWTGANWLEREIYDLFGITFEGHPNLERILTEDGMEGYPLRRDYPLTWEQPQFTWNKDDPPEVIR